MVRSCGGCNERRRSGDPAVVSCAGRNKRPSDGAAPEIIVAIVEAEDDGHRRIQGRRPGPTPRAQHRPAPRLPRGDPYEPRAGRAVSTERRERPVRQHERLLRRVLGLVDAAQDPIAGPEDPGGLLLDEDLEGLAIPCHECP